MIKDINSSLHFDPEERGRNWQREGGKNQLFPG